MTGIVFFTENFRDLSNYEGYQFEFVCDRCGNGYRSPFQRSKTELGRGLLRGVGSLLGGKAEEVSAGVEAFNGWGWGGGANSRAKDKALEAAVEAVKDQFRQCRGCGRWSCAQVCWNDQVGQCLTCSPNVADEVARAQASAQVSQIRQGVQETDWTKGLDLTSRAVVNCPHCHASVSGGKFCAACGSPLAAGPSFCSSCGAEHAPDAAFCSSCGATLSGPRPV